jgi:signal peptidase I
VSTLVGMTKLRQMRRNSLFELAFSLVIAVGLALTVQAYAVKPYRVPSGSMEPTLTIGQRVLVNRLSHRLGSSPARGDIIVFMPPASADSQTCANPHEGAGHNAPCGESVAKRSTPPFIKRVVAVGGDSLAIRNGHVVLNGVLQKEPFTAPCGGGPDCNFPVPIRIPKGYVYVMGDNRGDSDDSRFWGPVPVSAVIGAAFATYWPPDRIGAF